jgi:uncharacterized protein YjeT (DUF2065 family)
MVGEILTAVALVIVIEGLLPAISPTAYRRAAAQLSMLPDKSIRYTGLGLMVFGALLLHFVS